MSEACRHHISMQKDCPWCQRKGDKLFHIKEPFQLYNLHMGSFISKIAEQVQGPVAVMIVVKDLNGEKYTYLAGTNENLKELVKEATERIEDVKT